VAQTSIHEVRLQLHFEVHLSDAAHRHEATVDLKGAISILTDHDQSRGHGLLGSTEVDQDRTRLGHDRHREDEPAVEGTAQDVTAREGEAQVIVATAVMMIGVGAEVADEGEGGEDDTIMNWWENISAKAFGGQNLSFMALNTN